jgi:transcriptional regulator with XRE-family HTH domain
MGLKLPALAKNIRRLREAKGLTLEEVATGCDCRSKSAALNWETGRCTPRGKTLAKLARLLDTTESDLYSDPRKPRARAA